MTVVLEARSLSCGYGGVPVVKGVDLTVARGEIIALLGPNGAGKTTTLLTLGGVIAPLAGALLVDGKITSAPLHRRARRDLSLVMEDRSVFRQLTAAENLRVGRCDVDQAVGWFPELGKLLKRPAGLLSGGEQQMLTLARALARGPRLLLIDELSLGLAPLVVERLLSVLRSAAEDGMAIVLVEQHVQQALGAATRAYVMRRGEIVLHGSAAEVAERIAEIEVSYLSSRMVTK